MASGRPLLLLPLLLLIELLLLLLLHQCQLRLDDLD